MLLCGMDKKHQNTQTQDMGHGREFSISVRHRGVFPGGSRGDAGVRHIEAQHVRRPRALARARKRELPRERW